jgi:hypothetical protein
VMVVLFQSDFCNFFFPEHIMQIFIWKYVSLQCYRFWATQNTDM